MTEETLFNEIHRGQPERLAQVVLGHAIRTEEALRKRLGLTGKLAPIVHLEAYDSDTRRTGWRADLEVKRAKPLSSLRIELKLRAQFTRAQRVALVQRKMHVVVVPSDRVAQIKKEGCAHATVFSWKDLARHVRDAATRALLVQADAMNGWLLEKLPAEVLRHEMIAFCRGAPDASWSSVYKFLSAVHAQLDELLPHSYRSTGGWSCSRRDRYYGFYFFLERGQRNPKWWVGFENRGRNHALVLYKGKQPIKSIATLEAREVAQQILASAGRASP